MHDILLISTEGLLDLLQKDLEEISRIFPEEIIDILEDVVIYINISYRFPGHNENILGACCHQSAQWLIEVRCC